MTDPFANYNPEDDQQEKLPVIQLSTVGDVFKGTILRIGAEFTQTLDDNKKLTKYPVEVRLNFVNIKSLPEIADLQRAYEPPKVGEDAVYFVTKAKDDGSRHHIQEEIDKATRRSGVESISVGGELAGKLLEKIKNDKYPTRKPFKKHAFMYEPGDPFTTQEPVNPTRSAASAPVSTSITDVSQLTPEQQALLAQIAAGGTPATDRPPF